MSELYESRSAHLQSRTPAGEFATAARECRLTAPLLLALLYCLAGATDSAVPCAAPDGLASWYGEAHHGKLTASGERFDMHKLTAAHRTLPFGTLVRVTNCRNAKSVIVRINDRGPSDRLKRRIIDLSREAAERLDMIGVGLVPIDLEIVPIQFPVRNSDK